MYQLKDGILYRDGKKVFGLGESYYPSFHPCKFPVPPEGDRMGEMKKDLAGMAALGFNHVRVAALGDVSLQPDGTVAVSTPFIDEMTRQAEENGLSVSVREQGYAVNLRGFPNVEMIDWNGDAQQTVWSDFVRTTLCHPGLLEDNFRFAAALAAHFAQFPNVVGFQIYNEPHYPGKEVYDYHELTVQAYRRWLVEKQIFSEEEAKTYQPPRSRRAQDARMWALWRLFGRDSMSVFLCNAANGSKDGAPLPVFTCMTNDQLTTRSATRGCDVFATTKGMDMAGYTCYLHGRGVGYYPMCLFMDMEQCAAELEGTQSWCIELDSRTYISPALYNRSTYAVLGSGAKGIVYYQWRGDCPVEGVPHPNSCGILNYDGTKTANFDNAAQVNRYILRMNDELMGAQRVHEGIGLLHSDYAIFLSDANDNGDKQPMGATLRNEYVLLYTEVHKQLRAAGYNVTMTDAAHLDENRFAIGVLYVPRMDMLLPEELEAVERFRAKGGKVFTTANPEWGAAAIGFMEYTGTVALRAKALECTCTVYDVADMTEKYPLVEPRSPHVGVQLLQGDGYYLLVLTNLSVAKERIRASVRVRVPFSSAQFCAMDGDKPVLVKDGVLTVEDVTDGGIVVLR